MPSNKNTKKASTKTKFTKNVSLNSSQTQSFPVKPANSSATSFFKKPLVIILIILILLGFGFYFLRKWLVVAEVNGQPIGRLEYMHLLEQQNGDQVLNELIAKSLILQEADRRHITVTQSEIDSRIKEFQKSLSKQGQTLDQYLTTQKTTKQDFMDNVDVQIVLEKLLAKDIQVSDKEISDYMDQNKDSLPQGVSQNDLKQQIKQQLQQQKIQDRLPAFIQDLEKKAKIDRLISY